MAGRWIIWQGARQYGQGAAPSQICLAGTLVIIGYSKPNSAGCKTVYLSESNTKKLTNSLYFGSVNQLNVPVVRTSGAKLFLQNVDLIPPHVTTKQDDCTHDDTSQSLSSNRTVNKVIFYVSRSFRQRPLYGRTRTTSANCH